MAESKKRWYQLLLPFMDRNHIEERPIEQKKKKGRFSEYSRTHLSSRISDKTRRELDEIIEFATRKLGEMEQREVITKLIEYCYPIKHRIFKKDKI